MANALFNFSLEQKNREILERKKEETGATFGKTINALINTFGDMSESIKMELMTFTKTQLYTLIDQMDQAGDYELSALAEKTEKYLQIAAYLNNGQPLSLRDLKQEHKMQKIQIRDGVLICPKDYQIANPEEAESMMYACVIECRNATRYQIPHYLVFCDRKYGKDYDAAYEKRLLDKVVSRFPEFEKIIAAQVDPIPDPEHPGRLLNEMAHFQAPTIGFYSVYEYKDPAYPDNFVPPNDTQIIRNSLLDL